MGNVISLRLLAGEYMPSKGAYAVNFEIETDSPGEIWLSTNNGPYEGPLYVGGAHKIGGIMWMQAGTHTVCAEMR